MGIISPILKNMAMMCLMILGWSTPTGTITNMTENKTIEINNKKKINEVPQRG
jgi:hypothetical protein